MVGAVSIYVRVNKRFGKFFNVFAKFFDVFGSVRTCFDTFGYIQMLSAQKASSKFC